MEQARGYRLKLIYLHLPDVKIALERVAVRVLQGGHNVLESAIRRRSEAGWKNFNSVYKDIGDAWMLSDNSGRIPVLLKTGGRM